MSSITGVIRPISASLTNHAQSPLRVCLKFLEEGHDPAAALEFVAEWGTGDIQQQFQTYVKSLHGGRSIGELLEEIATDYPSPETELLIAGLEARLQTGTFAALTPQMLAQAQTLESRLRDDMELLIGPGRRWTMGLVWAGILGGSMLVIALPQYSPLLESRVGQVVLGAAIALEIVGLLWAGTLLRMQSRMEGELQKC